MSQQVYAGTVQYNMIYVFEIPDNAHKGYLKIGEHRFESPLSYKQLMPNCELLNMQAKKRIDQYTKTALIHYNLLHTELARVQVLLSDGIVDTRAFSDHDVHMVLDRSGFDVHKFHGTEADSEWYKVDLPQAIAAISAVKEGRNTLTAEEIKPKVSKNPSGIKLREEQIRCVKKTKEVFAKQDRMLWDCKMRFGKTITAYALIQEMQFQKVLVVTHRPVVADGWREDFGKMFNNDRVFLTKAKIMAYDRFTADDAGIDAENDRALTNLAQSKKPFVYFASMQDLRGSSLIGGKFSKNKAVFGMDWDLIIYDEAHEGTQTELGQAVQNKLENPNGERRPKVLQLSGTPYNLLHQYDDNVFLWDYVMEQEAKLAWEEKHPGDHNPYASLPRLNILTFDLRKKLVASYRYEDTNIAFNFREFFRTWADDPARDFQAMPQGAKKGDFVHKSDVLAFLNLISTESEDSNYPFSTPEYRDMFRHTFWILPGVKEAKAFASMLRRHPVFQAYEVVNVAGEGDVEKNYDDALKEVKEAIKKHDRTITLSCGKLTTGVTVKEWTGVMLLSGSSSTQAAGYMQTIFRVQSAGSIDGKQKMECYAFDFAPDRALKVLAEVHSLKKSAIDSDNKSRMALGKFLNFCPVLAEAGSGMEHYDVPRMMRQLKKIVVENAIKSGFDDDSIYKADAGIAVDDDKLSLINTLKLRLTPQKKAKKQTTVNVNKQGLTEEEYKKAQQAKNKRKKDLTEEEKALLAKEKEQKKEQQALFDLLRSVSIRLPLLIFGAAADFNESIRLSEFVNNVDDGSWQEFMPKELDKELFLKLLVFYDEDVIEGAGMRIRRMAKAADELMPTLRVMRIAEIFSYFKNPAKETVLTPWRVVNMHMGDTLGGYNFYKEGYPAQDGLLDEPRFINQGEQTSSLFQNSNAKVLEMNSKSGLYPLYVAYSMYRNMLPAKEEEMSLEEAQAIWRRALCSQLFVLCQTTMAVSITKRTLAGYSGAYVNAIYLPKLLTRMEDKPRLARKLTNPATWNKEGERLKFDAVVGNPPYQFETGGGARQAKPIYNLFVRTAKRLNPSYISMITPSRWFAGGMGLDEYRNLMMNDKTIAKIVDFTNSKDCFPTISISGGVSYFLMDLKNDKDCNFINIFNGVRSEMTRALNEFSVLVRYNEAVNILRKVIAKNENKMSDIVGSISPFGFATNARGVEKKDIKHDVCLYSSKDITYISSNLVEKGLDLLKKYKVMISQTSAEHAGEPSKDGKYRVLTSSMRVLNPNEACTHSYIIVGSFDNRNEPENLIGYFKLKFVRFLLLQALSSIHISKSTFVFVPMQDFSKPWTDAELYKKYGLTKEEIAFIEAMIKPMD